MKKANILSCNKNQLDQSVHHREHDVQFFNKGLITYQKKKPA